MGDILVCYSVPRDGDTECSEGSGGPGSHSDLHQLFWNSIPEEVSVGRDHSKQKLQDITGYQAPRIIGINKKKSFFNFLIKLSY